MELLKGRITSQIFTLVFVVAVFFLLFISGLSYRQIKSQQETEKWVTHTFTLQLLLEQLFSLTKDAETGQRGFIITQDSTFLLPYLNAQQKIDSLYRIIDVFTKDNAEQQENLKILKPLIKRRFELLKSRLEEADAEKYQQHLSIPTGKMQAGRLVMNMLRQQVNEMIKIERDLLIKRQKKHKSQLSLTPFFLLLLMFFSLIMFIAAFYKINKDVKKLRQLNNELVLNEESFDHAEKIANMSHWEWNLHTNILCYSENQYLLLGCEPHEFEPTIENFLQYVHPEDRDIILSSSEKVLNKQEASDVIFRVIRKDGALRYFKSMGKIVEYDNEKYILIGINHDITEQYLASKEIEKKNGELIRSNIELASFNHVASHDLQEPLRKIQLFISKILDEENLNLSERNMDYFLRMQASASRMQILINDLLAYSRVNGTDNTFEITDLNVIIETVLSELSQAQTIEEKNVTVNYKDLPEVNGIPFQLKQLFTNLIGNSLKYSNGDRAPIINIQATIADGKDIPNANVDANKKYNKISVSDNGLGFEQEYAEQIFTLFQRLHDKQTFSGTGIGLAICKKVVENHHGFIIATGKPDEGAIFDIYIPVLS